MGNENVFLKLLISVSISALSLRFIPKKYLAFLCGAFVYALFIFLIERNHPSKITFEYCVVYFSSMTGQFLIGYLISYFGLKSFWNNKMD